MVESEKHFTYLSEMGIALWQRRNVSVVTSNSSLQPEKDKKIEQGALNQHVSTEAQAKEKISSIAITLDELAANRLYNDVLLWLNVDQHQVKQHNESTILLGKFKWQFVVQDKVSFQDHLMRTPSLLALRQSAALKQQMFQLIQTQLLSDN